MSCIKVSQEDVAIIHLKKKDKRLATLINAIGDIECNVHKDGYQFVLKEIIGQMLSNKVADVLYAKFISLCDGTVTPEIVITKTVEEIRDTGVSNAKARSILAFTEAVISGNIPIKHMGELTDDQVYDFLTSVKGIGSWTAKMYLLFVKQSPDVLPYEDGAFLRTYKWIYKTDDIKPNSVRKVCKKWSPYSSTASRYFYRALDMGLLSNPFDDIKKEKEKENAKLQQK